MKFKTIYILSIIIIFFSCNKDEDSSNLCNDVLFYQDVAPIIYNNCVGCHSYGQSAESFGIFGFTGTQTVNYSGIFDKKDIELNSFIENKPALNPSSKS